MTLSAEQRPRTRPSRAVLLVATSFLLLAGCTATRSVRPIGEGKFGVGASVGGPVFTNFGFPVPTPLASAYGRYGLGKATDLEVGLHVPVIRNLGLDVGVAHLVLEQQGAVPAVMLGGRLYGYVNVAGLSGKPRADGGAYTLAPGLYEELQATASWKLADPVLVYAGLNLFAQAERLTVLPSLLAGVQWRPVPLFGLTLEAKQMAFLTNQKFAVVNFLGPADYGALGVQLGFNFYPGAE